ncbi:MAG: hypothetical protein GY901_07140 [Actinomycetia bacterium]|nr:hypothetical protein [Actinomycetes bacterium]
MSAAEEKLLVDDLVVASGTPRPPRGVPERADATLLLNMLRLGVRWASATEFLPGADAARLLSTHQYFTDRLDDVGAAWDGILDIADELAPTEPGSAPDLDVVADLDEPLHVLRTYLPAISSHISAQADAALQGFIEADVVRAVRFAETRMSSLRIKADDVEALLPSDQEFTERSYKLGLVLYHPFRECIWADDFHLPVRVGEVVPVMARRLLSENGKGTR